MSKTYNVGFVGFGFIGKVHAYGYLNLPLFYQPVPLRARITHVCTSRMETAQRGAETIGAETACTDFREITENPDIDIVHICTPNNRHKEALLSAMRHGKHIYCDKPLTATMQEAEEVRSALSSYLATAQMTLQNRFFPATMLARQLIDEGLLGQALQFRAAYLHSGSADPAAPLKWKLSAEYGGGVIADLGSHVLDLVEWLLGDIAEVMASTQIAYPHRPSAQDKGRLVPVVAEDSVAIIARAANGAQGVVEASKIATGIEDELRMEIHGSKGGIRFNTMDPHFLEVFDGRSIEGSATSHIPGWTRYATGQRYPAPANGFPTPKASIGWIRSHMACLANFLQDVADGKPGNPGLDQGIAIQRVMDAVHRSARDRVWVTV